MSAELPDPADLELMRHMLHQSGNRHKINVNQLSMDADPINQWRLRQGPYAYNRTWVAERTDDMTRAADEIVASGEDPHVVREHVKRLGLNLMLIVTATIDYNQQGEQHGIQEEE